MKRLSQKRKQKAGRSKAPSHAIQTTHTNRTAIVKQQPPSIPKLTFKPKPLSDRSLHNISVHRQSYLTTVDLHNESVRYKHEMIGKRIDLNRRIDQLLKKQEGKHTDGVLVETSPFSCPKDQDNLKEFSGSRVAAFEEGHLEKKLKSILESGDIGGTDPELLYAEARSVSAFVEKLTSNSEFKFIEFAVEKGRTMFDVAGQVDRAYQLLRRFGKENCELNR